MLEHAHNLLGHDFSPHVRRRRKILKYARNGLLIFLGLIIAAAAVVVLPSLGAMRAIYANAQAGKSDLFRAKDAAEKLDFSAASAALSDAAAHFETAQDAMNRLGLVARTPWFRKEIEALRDVLEGGRSAAVALGEAIDVGADLMAVFRSGVPAGGLPGLLEDQRPVSELSREDRRALLQKLIEAPDRLVQARTALDRAIEAFDRIPSTPLTKGLIETIAPYKRQLAELREFLARDLSLLSQIPPMIGYPEPKTYLFLLLNNTEMRPGGGFIGTYGIVKLSDGEIESFFTDDVYDLDGPSEAYLKETPPEPLRKYLRAPGWFMRDANWSPDFVASAMLSERFYRLEGGPEKNIDGIIGMTPTVISRLLDVTGPIVVDGSRFDAANITDELEYQVERGFAQSGVPYAQRKDIVGKLADALIQKMLSTSLMELPRLLAIAGGTIEEKHLMLYFKDPQLQAVADARKWSGRLEVRQEDQLAVIDANLASLKSDPAVERTISYALRPDGDRWIARAQVTYKHKGRFDWKTTRYRTYTRFYVPIGSTFLKGEGMMVDDKINDPARRTGTIDVGEEHGRTVFGGFISIEPGETRTLAVEYRASDAVARMLRGSSYRLNVQKQLGTPGHQLTLDLDFGKNLLRAVPPEDPAEWGDGRYRVSTDLRVDRTFTVEMK